jgi:hypothetical protein
MNWTFWINTLIQALFSMVLVKACRKFEAVIPAEAGIQASLCTRRAIANSHRNRFLRFFASLTFLFAAAAAWTGPALAQDHEHKAAQWHRLTPEERREMRARFRALPPERQAEVLKKFETWRRMPAEEKARVRRNFEHWQQLPPGERERLRERWERWRRLPVEERQALRERFRHSPPEEKQRTRERLHPRLERLVPDARSE